jgi:hypothetical protein
VAPALKLDDQQVAEALWDCITLSLERTSPRGNYELHTANLLIDPMLKHFGTVRFIFVACHLKLKRLHGQMFAVFHGSPKD